MLKNADNTTKLFLIGIVFLLMIVYILATTISDNKEIDYAFIDDYFNKISDNYTMGIKTSSKEIIYSRDKDFEIYESNNFENKLYLKYNNKTYIIVDDKLKEIENDNDLLDRYYYDIKLIKELLKHCNYKSYRSEVTCRISADDFNKEFLSLYGLGRLGVDDVTILFNHSEDNIDKIVVNTNEDKYNISISNIDKNDYSNYQELIK